MNKFAAALVVYVVDAVAVDTNMIALGSNGEVGLAQAIMNTYKEEYGVNDGIHHQSYDAPQQSYGAHQSYNPEKTYGQESYSPQRTYGQESYKPQQTYGQESYNPQHTYGQESYESQNGQWQSYAPQHQNYLFPVAGQSYVQQPQVQPKGSFNENAKPSIARLNRAEGPLRSSRTQPNDPNAWVRRSSKRPRDNWAANVDPVDPFYSSQTPPKDAITAHCKLDFLGYSDSTGHIVITQEPGDLASFVGEFKNLEPGLHAMKIHEYGDLEYGCNSVGPVFNPFGMERGHSHDDINARRVGDMENVQARFDTHAEYKNRDGYATMWGPNNILGRSIVLYEREDDHDQREHSAKIGDDGRPVEARTRTDVGMPIACCVIGRMDKQPEPKEKTPKKVSVLDFEGFAQGFGNNSSGHGFENGFQGFGDSHQGFGQSSKGFENSFGGFGGNTGGDFGSFDGSQGLY